MLPFKLVYHPEHNLEANGHVFPWHKYRLVHDALLREGFASPSDFVEPHPASDADVRLVHSPGWVEALKRGTLRPSQIARLEIPYSPEMVRAFWLAAGGTTLAARLALRDGVAVHLGGGFHHAFYNHGEGFCAIHDAAIAIRRLQHEGRIERAMVVDCDVHQGNGTAALFAYDDSVFTLSIHQLHNYPVQKPPSDVDINLDDGTGDAEYLERLREAYLAALDRFRPDLVLYVAGADPYRKDRLGGLALTKDGLKARDRAVLSGALVREIPVAVTLAGGYAVNVNDTVAIHMNTAKMARKAAGCAAWAQLTGELRWIPSAAC
jgi:acetoin utilization deacetylase AcuC-like enzyme